MKLFRPNTFNVIFLAPVVIGLSDNGGCGSAGEQTVLTKTQIEEVMGGNTVQAVGEDRFAFAGKDGTLKGLNLKNGGETGEWRVSDNNVLCARWNEVDGGKENCDVMKFVGDQTYKWAGVDLKIIKGNHKNL